MKILDYCCHLIIPVFQNEIYEGLGIRQVSEVFVKSW